MQLGSHLGPIREKIRNPGYVKFVFQGHMIRPKYNFIYSEKVKFLAFLGQILKFSVSVELKP